MVTGAYGCEDDDDGDSAGDGVAALDDCELMPNVNRVALRPVADRVEPLSTAARGEPAGE